MFKFLKWFFTGKSDFKFNITDLIMSDYRKYYIIKRKVSILGFNYYVLTYRGLYGDLYRKYFYEFEILEK